MNKIRLTVLIALLFSALCAGVFRTPPILFMAALLTSAPFVSMLIGVINNRYLKITRSLPETGMVGDVVTGEITVSNRALWPTFLIHARSGFAERRMTTDSRRGKEKKDQLRKTKTPHHAIVPCGNDHQVVPMLRGHSQARWQQQWMLSRRGVHTLLPAQAGVLDPMGLSTRLPILSSPQQITVLPRPIRLDQLGFLGGAGQEEQLPRHSTIVADAMDFHGVRPWMPGEAIRRAHWKYTARTGQLYVIEWEEAPASDLAILLDAHAAALVGDEDESTLETAIIAAASIAAYLLEHGCRLQLFYFAPGEDSAPISPSKNSKSERGQSTAQPNDRQSPPRAPQLRSLLAHSVDHLDSVLRALAEVVPVDDERASASALADIAAPQVARGMGTLLIASSLAPLEKLRAASPASNRSLHTLIVDAESFRIDKDASKQNSKSASPVAAVARRQRRMLKTRAPMLRRGDSIAAVIEGHV